MKPKEVKQSAETKALLICLAGTALSLGFRLILWRSADRDYNISSVNTVRAVYLFLYLLPAVCMTAEAALSLKKKTWAFCVFALVLMLVQCIYGALTAFKEDEACLPAAFNGAAVILTLLLLIDRIDPLKKREVPSAVFLFLAFLFAGLFIMSVFSELGNKGELPAAVFRGAAQFGNIGICLAGMFLNHG